MQADRCVEPTISDIPGCFCLCWMRQSASVLLHIDCLSFCRLYRGEQFTQGPADFHADPAAGVHHLHSVGWLFFQVRLCGALRAELVQSCSDMI